jgi:diguanylate cyclase (GGDEF)-like protein
MATFLSTQLDFILFFYGLAFILLGTTCFSIAKRGERAEPWAVLGLFAYAHGVSEWSDLSALIVGDTPAFAIARTALMTGSFILLMEFARLEALRLGMRLPGRWVHIPLVLLVVFAGFTGGVNAAGVVGRYAIGFVGAMATSWIFACHARGFSGVPRRLAIFAAVGFVVYGVAAGAIVPAAPFWPATIVNYTWFASLTGVPIQLVRGTVACWITFSIWSIWGHAAVLEVASERYTANLRQQFFWTVVAMGIILTLGWLLTDFLGGIYQQNVQEEARGDIDLLASRLDGETEMTDAMARALAGSPTVLPFLVGGSKEDLKRAQSVLELDVEASGSTLGLILDLSGTVVASSDRRQATPSAAPEYHAYRFFQRAVARDVGHQFAFDIANGGQNYYASDAVRSDDGKVIGVALLKMSLGAFGVHLRQFDRPYFLIDPDGIVVMTNRPSALLRTMWPLSPERKLVLAQQFGALNDQPMLKHQLVDATWTSVEGDRNYVRRRFADHSQWSVVILKPTHEIFASRVLGIIITLMVTLMTLIYLFGKERWVHEKVETDKRLRLQEQALHLGHQATTDPLTGLYNRLKFDKEMTGEILRSDRYRSSFSLVVFDIDKFKQINDMHGHQTGDKVLVQLSRLALSLIRSTDLLARWGGEEFVVLVPGGDGEMASQVAEKLRNGIGHDVFDDVGTVTCSFGVAQYVEGDTAEALIGRADGALYRAKLKGRNRVELGLRLAGGTRGVAGQQRVHSEPGIAEVSGA